jgi:hypothetical protein
MDNYEKKKLKAIEAELAKDPKFKEKMRRGDGNGGYAEFVHPDGNLQGGGEHAKNDAIIGIITLAATAALAGFGSSRAEATPVIPDTLKATSIESTKNISPKSDNLIVDLSKLPKR